LGGWAKFYGVQITRTIVDMLGVEDTNNNLWLAYGAVGSPAQLAAVQCFKQSNGLIQASTAGQYFFDITPTYVSDVSNTNFQTTAGSNAVTITDNIVTQINFFDTVAIPTYVSVGGLTLQGQYQPQNVSVNSYAVASIDTIGNALPALFTTSPSAITITGGTYSVTPTQNVVFSWATPNYTFPVGDFVTVKNVVPADWNGTWIVSASTSTSVTLLTPGVTSTTYTSGGTLTNWGSPPVITTQNGSNVFTIFMPFHQYQAGSTFSLLTQTNCGGALLYGNYVVQQVLNSYSFTIYGQQQATSTSRSYIDGISVVGGSSTTSAVTLNFLPNVPQYPNLIISSGSSTTSAVTLNWTNANYLFTVGQTIIVSGIVTPSSWNGTYTVTASSSGSVTYSLSGSALTWVSGGTVFPAIFNIGSQISVSGVSPSAWNGNYTITATTLTSVTYALSGSALSWISNGSISNIGGNTDFIYIIGAAPNVSPYGYGVGGYGVGGYGSGQTVSQNYEGGTGINATSWFLTNWGQAIVACPVGFSPLRFQNNYSTLYQPLLYWDPTSSLPSAQIIANGPMVSSGVIVALPQRQIVAWGTSFTGIPDPLLIRWCDVNNYNVWLAQITNQAGSFRLTGGSIIVAIKRLATQLIVWTDIGVWTMQYIGPPLVYSFNLIGTGCGLIGPHAAGVINNIVFWMGYKGFYLLSGSGTSPLPCHVWDYLFQELDQANVQNVVCAVNSMFQEITWYFPVAGGNGTATNYVKYNIVSQAWDIGVLSRSAWVDNGVLGPPIGYDTVNQYIYQHEIANDADGVAMPSTFTSGYAAMAEGDGKVFVDQIWPDFKYSYYGGNVSANVSITFNVVDYPGQTPQTFGPYTFNTMSTYVTPRFRGRLISYTISSSDTGTWWRIGRIRYRMQMDGKF
jgi:hypothetical protein